MSQGKLIIVAGPSGVGKRTLIQHALGQVPNCWFSVSATTRGPRKGERDGDDYHFMSPEEFRASAQKNGFLEYEEFAGEQYGTPREPIEEQLRAGVNVIAEMEVKGARKVKSLISKAETVFVMPPEPMLETLRKRILGRGGVSPESLERRLNTAKEELAQRNFFDHRIVNDDMSAAQEKMVAKVRAILRKLEPVM